MCAWTKACWTMRSRSWRGRGRASTRGALMLHRAAQARAFLQGRDYCLPDDFKQLIVPVFAHRVIVNTRYISTQKKSEQAENLLHEMVESVRVPL